MLLGFTKLGEDTYLYTFNEDSFEISLEKTENRNGFFGEDLKIFMSREEEKLDFIDGVSLESSNLRFFIHQSRLLKHSTKTLKGRVSSYIIYKGEVLNFNRLGFQSEELDYFYNKNQAIKFSIDKNDSGVFHLSTLPFNELHQTFTFEHNNKEYDCSLNVSRSYKNEDVELSLKTELAMQFKNNSTLEIEDTHKLVKSYMTLMKLISYRKNVDIPIIKLKKMDADGKYMHVADYYFYYGKSDKVENKKILERTINYMDISGEIGGLFKLILNDQIYLEQIPENSNDFFLITASRFIMVSAGFEWQQKLLNKKEVELLIEENEKNLLQEKVLAYLEEEIKSHTGKNKKYFKGLKKLVQQRDNSLGSRIEKVLIDYDSILKPFITNLYAISDSGDYSSDVTAERLNEQRNDFAHGNLDKGYNKKVTVDFVILEWVYYILVLKHIGIDDLSIQKTINKLFNRRLAI
ncbi:HEPN domain-containing protein [Alkalicoccobacillus plakortidis]|uniref:ApeA N-terminal domain-containing protein n=1 Tax=Alkalicoccobacillus plakortidis TaxID=444060 RepID=A0ABT0XHW7_9BACI|nr:HEPN domain-containing protein [Alkalicoccobacillus plakortidis]MCM2675488.1 hypothetical protein [Alkalicoccobacillus plakortidis]